ncbi:FixH family protein [Chitinophaga sp.]|uniref:FixH family protein n=1 Tax=Chitinophaga sp. TaxID=1869181 RepID=UPI0026017D3B|nr:FixH family protein [uncultured Chitinophaga sp.]
MKKYFLFLLAFTFAAIITGCSKDNMEPAPEKIPYQKMAEGYATGAGVKVELYAKKAFSTGYNPIYVALYDSISGKPLEKAQITLQPMMDMGTMKHASPVEQPSGNAENKLFPAAVVFTMPSGEMGSWTLSVSVSGNGRQGIATLPAVVTAPAVARLKSFVSKADNAKFFVAYILPDAPKVGVNELEIAVYKVKNMMEFPADSSLTVSLTPEMPTMGHGSPNNADPVHIGKGHYKGKANFTMTGLWYLHLGFKAGAAVADEATYFEVNF